MRNHKATVSRELAADLEEFQSMPILHEDDPEWDMGEANLHSLLEDILRYGIAAHLLTQPRYRVFGNLNLHYQPRFPSIYISPDVMVTTPRDRGRIDLKGYYVDKDGPAPVLVTEVLSESTARERDLGEKLYLYAMIGVAEYLLVDPSSAFLPERLLLKRLQADRTWKNEQDPDGGVTSRLGFRVIWDTDDELRVLHAVTGIRYPRPEEAYLAVLARHEAEERVRQLEAELERLQTGATGGQAKKPVRKKRRKP